MENKNRKPGADLEADFLDKVRSRPKLNPNISKPMPESTNVQAGQEVPDGTIPDDADIKNTLEMFGDYKNIFLDPKEHEVSKRISIEKSVHFKISLIVTIMEDKRFNISTYVNNILTEHFQRYDHIYKALIDKHLKP